MADIKPVYKIEVYDPSGPTLRHSITSDAPQVSITPRVTSGIGTFNFVLARGSGTDWTKFNDIALYDDVYIWLDYDTLSANPRMRGKITNISDRLGPALVPISGKNYGETLQRLLKTKYWESTRADTIVKEINDDAGYDGSYNHIATDATTLDYDAVDKPLIEILQDISEIRDKDWYVAYCYTHNATELYWFARQSNVSSITLKEGDNINQYRLLKDLNPVRNDVTVYGARLLTWPTDKDARTETTTLWSGTYDSISTNADCVMGSVSIQFDRASASNIIGINTIPTPPDTISAKFPHEYRNLHFALKYVAATGNPGTISIRLRKDNSNYFRTILYPEYHNMSIGGDWVHFVIPLGREHEGSGANNEWATTGTVEWDEIDTFWFMPSFTGSGTVTVRIDELYFGEARVVGTASDGTSQSAYGTRSMVVIDDDMSSSAVSDYATYLNAQLKDPIVQLDVVCPAELSLQVGDQVPIDIASKSISANYDLLQVTHTLNQTPPTLTSRCLLSDRKQIRDVSSFRDFPSAFAKVTRRLDFALSGKIVK